MTMKWVFFFLLSPVLLLLFSNGKIHSWRWQADCLEIFRRCQFLRGDSRSYNLQLHTDAWPGLCCIFGTASRFVTLGPPLQELPITSNKTPDAAWEHIMLLAPVLVHKHFIAYFAYLYRLVRRTVRNTCLKSMRSLSLSADTGPILQKVLKDFPSALHMLSLHF